MENMTSQRPTQRGGDLPPNIFRISGIYRLKAKIASGSFGSVYQGIDLLSRNPVAVKMERVDTDNPRLRKERLVYKALGESVGIPRVLWFGNEGGYTAMVTDLLGPSLGTLLSMCGGRFTAKCALMLGAQLIARLEYLHSRGYIHRDIKPDNVLMGRQHESSVAHLIDFGLANQYRSSISHIPLRRYTTLIGTPRFISINGHRGLEQSRRDDLESLAYMLVYFVRGKLPWQGLEATSSNEKYAQIMQKKIDKGPTLCAGLPTAFSLLLQYSLSLAFDEDPDYQYLHNLFEDSMEEMGIVSDDIFDWSTQSDLVSPTRNQRGSFSHPCTSSSESEMS